jgi:hypothetical protein
LKQIAPDLLAPHPARIEFPKAKVASSDSQKPVDSLPALTARVIAKRG